MPRIDPLDLLKCLGVLLSSNGGIKGPTEVDRVARLMLRFSKKLVSKCIYIHVLKATPTELLDQFLNQNGAYVLVMKWLAEAHQTRNTPLLVEMLELLQLLPLSDARLKDPNINEFFRTSLHYNDLAQLIQSIVQEFNDQNCRNLAMQFWSRWFSKPSQPEEFSLTQAGILPEDMDLSIYAPDTSSAAFGDPLNMSIGDDVGMAINNLNNLASLDMNNCAQFMENSEFYTMNHFESASLSNNLEQANHPVFMDSSTASFGNDALTGQQHLLHQLQQQTQPMQQPMLQQQHALVHPVLNPSMDSTNAMLPGTTNWAGNNLGTVHVISESNLEQLTMGEVKTSESTSGLPILKIKIEGRKYVVKNSTDDVEMKEESQNSTETCTETKGKEKSQEKDKEKDKEKPREKDKEKEKSRDKDKKKDKDKEKKSSSRSRDDGKKSSSDSKKREKERDREKSKSSSSSKEKSSSSSSKERSKSSSGRDEKKDKDRDKDKSRVKSSSKTEAQLKEAKQAEKNRETLATLKAMTPVVKLAKIPRKKVEETAETPAEATAPQSVASVTDVLDKLAPRPKTVKTFNSKFRSTGLVEEPAIVGSKKPAVSSPLAVDKKSPIIKRTGSSDGLIPPADKKMKTIDDSAISAAVAAVMKKTAGELKPAIKLISPRPRPLLQDSSLFMDALEAGSKASTKKKRPLKDGAEIVSGPVKSQDSPAPLSVASPAPPLTPPIALAPSATLSSASTAEANVGDTSPVPLKPMFKFYQDTLEADEAANEEKTKTEPKEIKEESAVSPAGEKTHEAVEGTVEAEDGNSRDSSKTEVGDDEIPSDEKKPKGVLVIHSQQRRRPKKMLRWREDHELERHHFFELDETERVNVNKLQFFEMKLAEREREKQAVKMSKHLTEEAEVEEQPWKPLIRIDVPEDRVIYGENSQEKHIQEARESSTLQALYFKGQILPDSPAEPDPEVPLERVAEPTVIPLDDVTGNPESIYDHRHVPWPEPKSYGSSSSYQSHQSQLPKHPMGVPHQPYGPPAYRGLGAGPAEAYYPERGPGIHGDHPGYGSHPDAIGYGGPGMHPDGPDVHHAGPDMAYGAPDGPYGGPDGLHGGPPIHQYQTGRVGPPGRGDDRGAWMAGDGTGYPEIGAPRYDGPPHRDQRLPRDPYREMDHPRDRGMGGGYGDRMVGPGPGYIGPPRGMNMEGPRPRFHGPPRGGRGGGPPPGRGGPSSQPCWHFMRGFCRLENRCKFLHPNTYNGAQMP